MLLITGATGYIGQELLKQLKSKDVLLLSRKSRESSLNVEVLVGDLTKPTSIIGKLDKVDRVIHMAALTHSHDKKKYWEVNYQGTLNLLKALDLKKIKQFVYVSTNCAEPGSGGYGESKLAAEKEIKRKVDNYTILRVGDVYGGGSEKSIENLVSFCKKSKFFPLVGSGKWKMVPIHVNDLVRVIAKAAKLKGKKEFVVSGLEIIIMRDLVSQIYKSIDKRGFLIPVPIFIYKILVNIASKLHISNFYPDQIQRLVVKKKIDSKSTWKFFGINPGRFSNLNFTI